MNQYIEFKTPTPKPWLMKLMAPVTQRLCLQGMPILRHLPLLNRLPGIRGLARVSQIDFPFKDQQQLRQLTGKNKATFFLPNHPEFFTDWMLDKYILSRVAPKAACWASASIVNGMGRIMQRFWLSNNLIAQIPGQSDQGKCYAINSAINGDGVLLHPEGKVNWLGNRIAPLFGGAFDMAVSALNKGLTVNPNFQSWLAPVVWALRFDNDVHLKLLEECRYVEKRLHLQRCESDCAARRTHAIYYQLALRDYRAVTGQDHFPNGIPLSELHKRIIDRSYHELVDRLSLQENDPQTVLREVRKELKSKRANADDNQHIRRVYDCHQRWSGLDECIFAESAISQEQVAEHLKRIRSQYCQGTLIDTLNKFIPQAAGHRTAYIRSVKPIAIHHCMTDNQVPDRIRTMECVRRSMQNALNKLVDEIEQKQPALKVDNPFYY